LLLCAVQGLKEDKKIALCKCGERFLHITLYIKKQN